MIRVRQKFDAVEITDIEQDVRREMQQKEDVYKRQYLPRGNNRQSPGRKAWTLHLPFSSKKVHFSFAPVIRRFGRILPLSLIHI